ncbi:MAG: hypothetical protein JNM95_13490 [Chitinophagaceae bacterium]|nr:hypothetical protein [Chitinophagaceae bacterium]
MKKKFDDPPDVSNYDPKLKVTNTIWELKQKFYNNGGGLTITDDVVIYGIVTADDRSGNFYKQIMIQDSTSGIAVLLNRSSGLYNDYPIGRKVYIKCKGLYLGAYGNFLQLGGGYDAIGNSVYEIPSASFDKYIVKANYPNTITPLKVKIADILFSSGSNQSTQHKQWLGRLIEIDSTEFVPQEVGQPFAQDPNISSGTDRTIQDCSGSKIVVRNSGYSQFRILPIPAGGGKLTAIYSTYETGTKKTPQLLLRDTSDVPFHASRCGGIVITPPVDITIDSLRKIYKGTDSTQTLVLANYKIHGIVISKISPDSNISKYNLMLQDESGRGIVVYYSNGYSYQLGDSLLIDVSAEDLTVYRGTMEVTATIAKTSVKGTGKTVNPVIVTLAQLNADLNNLEFNKRQYESTLVKVLGCTISGSTSTYSGDKTLTDATGSLTLFTRFNASFANSSFPTNAIDITGIATKFYYTKNEITIRTLNDIQ